MLHSKMAHYPREAWSHNLSGHLVVASCYCCQFPIEVAMAKLRCGIRSYNEKIGIANTESSGYHETITLFWCKLIWHFLRRVGPGHPTEVKVSFVLNAFSDKNTIWREYYSFDIIASKEARKKWVEPDLKPIC